MARPALHEHRCAGGVAARTFLTMGAALLGAGSACSVDVSLEGKRCPCAEGYECDVAQDRCVQQVCEPTFTTSGFSAMWSTPNTIQYGWVPEGAAEDFLRYEIVVAENEADLVSRQGTARVIGPETHPELAFYLRPQGGVPVDRTMVLDLAPGTFYVARLFATDIRQCAFASELLATRTSDAATAQIALFDDVIPSGAYALPPEGVVVEDGEIVYTPANDPLCAPEEGADPVCGPPVRVQGLDVVLSQAGPEAPGLSGGTFARAFLEIRVRNEGEVHSHISEVSLWPDGCSDQDGIYELAGFTLAANETYQSIQVPLTELSRVGDGAPLTFGVLDVMAGGTSICGVAIGAQWNKAGRAVVDHMLVRY